jgi:predicted small metal-binding protein
MSRKMMDCRDFPSESKCTLTISGEDDEVLRAAVMHAVDVHGHKNTPELRNELKKALKPEPTPARR